MQLETDRLLLRPFTQDDLYAFAAINADPAVMAFFPAPYSREETRVGMEKTNFKWNRDGIGFSAMILKENGALVGMNGLSHLDFPKGHFLEGIVEIGWRLAADYWGKGLASEAASRWLRYGFEEMGLSKIGSYASASNHASFAVMKRIGMKHMADCDFIHHALPKESPLQPMQYYQIERSYC